MLILRVPETSPLPESTEAGAIPGVPAEPSTSPTAPLLQSSALEATAKLFWEYRDALIANGVPIDDFQGYGDEIRALPYKYTAAKRGCILLALVARSIDGVDRANSSIAAAADSTSTVTTLPQLFSSYAVAGCIALKDISEYASGGNGSLANTGEVKRLYVCPSHRRLGIAERLSQALETIARDEFKYNALVLDTLHRLDGALALYTKLGYSECDAYVHNPMHDVVFMRKTLQMQSTGTLER